MDPEVLTHALLLAREQAGDDPELAKALLQALASEHGKGEAHESKDSTGHEHDAKGRFGSGGSSASKVSLHDSATDEHLAAVADVAKGIRTVSTKGLAQSATLGTGRPSALRTLTKQEQHTKPPSVDEGEQIRSSLDAEYGHMSQGVDDVSRAIADVPDAVEKLASGPLVDRLKKQVGKLQDDLQDAWATALDTHQEATDALGKWQQAADEGGNTQTAWSEFSEAYRAYDDDYQRVTDLAMNGRDKIHNQVKAIYRQARKQFHADEESGS